MQCVGTLEENAIYKVRKIQTCLSISTYSSRVWHMARPRLRLGYNLYSLILHYLLCVPCCNTELLHRGERIPLFCQSRGQLSNRIESSWISLCVLTFRGYFYRTRPSDSMVFLNFEHPHPTEDCSLAGIWLPDSVLSSQYPFQSSQ